MTFGELFAGIHGFGIGLESAGLTPAWAVEIDASCQKVSRRHYPDLLRFSDVRTVGANNLPHVDLIAFGSPCQDLSIAGNRKGLAGERSGLFHEAIRVISELRPRYALFENVPGLFSSHNGRDFAAVLDGFLDIGACDICWRVLDAQWCGVPQRRRRVFLVADFGGERAQEVLLEQEGVRWHPPTRRTPREDLAATLGGGSSERGWCDNTDRMTFVPIQYAEQANRDKRQNGVGNADADDPMYTLDCSYQHGVMAFDWQSGGDVRLNCHSERTSALGCSQIPALARCQTSREGMRQEETQETYIVVHENKSGNLAEAAHSRANRAGASHSYQMVAAWDERNITSAAIRSTVSPDAPCPTLHQDSMSLAAPSYVRRLTPKECERLQGFPDVINHAIIAVCGENQRRDALAGLSNRSVPPSVSNAEENALLGFAPFAEVNSVASRRALEAPADLTVLISSERKEVLIHSHGRSLWSVSNAENTSSSLQVPQVGDFVRHAVLIVSTLAQITRHGKAGSLQNREPSVALLNGSNYAIVYGQGIGQFANDAESDGKKRTKPSKSTIFVPTGSGPNTDSTLTTSCSFVLRAIASFIPDRTQLRNGRLVKLLVVSGWTEWGVDADGKKVQMSDAARYRMLGNAVCVPVSAWIGFRLRAVWEQRDPSHYADEYVQTLSELKATHAHA